MSTIMLKILMPSFRVITHCWLRLVGCRSSCGWCSWSKWRWRLGGCSKGGCSWLGGLSDSRHCRWGSCCSGRFERWRRWVDGCIRVGWWWRILYNTKGVKVGKCWVAGVSFRQRSELGTMLVWWGTTSISFILMLTYLRAPCSSLPCRGVDVVVVGGY